MKINLIIKNRKGFLREIYADNKLLGTIERYKGFDNSWKITVYEEKYISYNLPMNSGRFLNVEYNRSLKNKNSGIAIAKNHKYLDVLGNNIDKYSEQYFNINSMNKIDFQENIDDEQSFGWTDSENGTILKVCKNKSRNEIFLSNTYSLSDANVCLLIIYSLGLRYDLYTSNNKKWFFVFISLPIIFGIYVAIKESVSVSDVIPTFIAAAIIPFVCAGLLYTVIFNSSRFNL